MAADLERLCGHASTCGHLLSEMLVQHVNALISRFATDVVITKLMLACMARCLTWCACVRAG